MGGGYGRRSRPSRGDVTVWEVFHRRAARLYRQHAQLSRLASQILHGARAVGTSLDGWKPIEQQFRDFASILLTHEANEDALVQDAFLSDTGEVD